MSEVAIIGAGIVGLAVGRALVLEHDVSPVIVEASRRVATEQTGHNSGVIHSGLYYRPGSQKARDCVSGQQTMYAFCREHGLAHERCGKLVVATSPVEVRTLEALERRGNENGLEGLRRVGAEGLLEFEPHVRGLAGLWVPSTGIVDFGEVGRALARELESRGAAILTGARVRDVRRRGRRLILDHGGGRIETDYLINCAGLQSDRVARMCGVDPGLRIVPFRGEYYRLAAGRERLVRNLVYPVPDPALPFLGVHFTRKLSGDVEVGPNAFPAWSRERYGRFSISPRDAWSTLSYPGFWRLVARHRGFALGEMRRSLTRGALARNARRLVPDVTARDLERDGRGIRAQAVEAGGRLIDDFRILESERTLHVLNAPSPAATAALAIGRHVAGLAARR